MSYSVGMCSVESSLLQTLARFKAELKGIRLTLKEEPELSAVELTLLPNKWLLLE